MWDRNSVKRGGRLSHRPGRRLYASGNPAPLPRSRVMMLQAVAAAALNPSTRVPPRPRPLTPSDYALRYHNLAVTDYSQGLFDVVNITRYQNGPRGETTTEYSALIGAIKKILNVKHLANPFTFPAGDVMGPAEWFFPPGLRRAFNGKGSPAEIADVLRLAVRCGRIGQKT